MDGLEALAAQAARFDGLVCPILDARAGQVYTALFENGVRVMDDVPLKLEELLDSLRPKGKKVLFVGDGVPVQAQRLQQEDFAVLGAPSLHGLHASFAAQIAAAHPESWVDAAALRPSLSARAAGRNANVRRDWRRRKSDGGDRGARNAPKRTSTASWRLSTVPLPFRGRSRI